GAILTESTLSFLGLGFPSDVPTWGRLLYDAKDYNDIAPHWAFFPGFLIFLTVLSINYVGDGLRDARLVEVEAYHGRRDPASHAFRGPTPRTEVMFGRPGHAYVYLSHGVWYCMNVVAHESDIAGAVLLRGAEPLQGFANDARLSGPGLLGRAFALTTSHSGIDLTRSALQLRDAPAV